MSIKNYQTNYLGVNLRGNYFESVYFTLTVLDYDYFLLYINVMVSLSD